MLKHARWADEIWHAGDWGNGIVHEELSKIAPIRGVYGNIDGQETRAIYPLHNRFVVDGLDVWITHIGGYPNHYHPSIKTELRMNPPQIFICGHSHILKIMRDQQLGFLHINPGAAGISGFHTVRTMVRFEIVNGKPAQAAVIDLGPRTQKG